MIMEGIQSSSSSSSSFQLQHLTKQQRSLGDSRRTQQQQQQQQMICCKNNCSITTYATRTIRRSTGAVHANTKNNTNMIVKKIVSFICLLLICLHCCGISINMNNHNHYNYYVWSAMASDTTTTMTTTMTTTANTEAIVVPVGTVQQQAPHHRKQVEVQVQVQQTLEPWYMDFYTLPHDVPWPGIKWYDRMATEGTVKASPRQPMATTMMMLSNTNNRTQQQIVPTTSNDNNNNNNNSTNKYVFVWDGIEYSSIHALFVYNDPMKYACRNFNSYINSIFISRTMMEYILHTTQSVEVTHYILCYIRNFIGAMIIYYGTAAIFHYFCYIYPPIAKETFQLQNSDSNSNNDNDNNNKKRPLPSTSTILHQITLAQCSLFLYVLLPVVDEYVVEQNMTQVYFTLSQVNGIYMYLLYLLLYFTLVEVGIYWMHRTLHTNKVLYKYIHMKHHQYNKIETLTPWASIAFHPLDGILQASPYFIVIFIVPCHYMTHVALLFFTAIWATYIHDAMDFNFFNHAIIMGSKYHTIHHTHYIYNYGQVFTFCDRVWGTLRIPTAPTGTTGSTASNTGTTKSTKQSSVKME